MILIIVEVRIMVISDFLNKANGFCAFNDVLENPCDKIIWNKEDLTVLFQEFKSNTEKTVVILKHE